MEQLIKISITMIWRISVTIRKDTILKCCFVEILIYSQIELSVIFFTISSPHIVNPLSLVYDQTLMKVSITKFVFKTTSTYMVILNSAD